MKTQALQEILMNLLPLSLWVAMGYLQLVQRR